MKKIKCLVVDDEPVARKVIKEFIEETSFLSFSYEAESAIQAERLLKQENIELVFLDIEMPKLSGIEWLKKTVFKPMIIISTAYPEFALESYDLDVMDYLVKPVSPARFRKATLRAKEYYDLKDSHKSETNHDWIFVRTERMIEKLHFAEIYFIESVGNYVKIHTTNNIIMAYLTLKSIEEQLPDNLFIKIHQSYIINISHLKTIERNIASVANSSLPISRAFSATLRKLIDEKTLKRR